MRLFSGRMSCHGIVCDAILQVYFMAVCIEQSPSIRIFDVIIIRHSHNLGHSTSATV